MKRSAFLYEQFSYIRHLKFLETDWQTYQYFRGQRSCIKSFIKPELAL